MSPGRQRHGLPFAESIEAKIQQPLRLVFLGRNQTDNILIESLGDKLLLKLGRKTVLILALGYFFYDIFHLSVC